MSILLDPNKSFISIKFYYIEEQTKHGVNIFHFIKTKEDFEEWKNKGYQTKSNDIKDESNAKIIKEIDTWWKRISWKDQNIIYSRSFKQISNSEGKLINDIDVIKFRDLKLRTCLKKWSLTDENKNNIDVNDEMIDMLDPRVAEEFLSSFEKLTEATEEEKKD